MPVFLFASKTYGCVNVNMHQGTRCKQYLAEIWTKQMGRLPLNRHRLKNSTKRSLKGAIKQLKAKLDQRYKAIFSQFPSFIVKVKLKLSK